MTVAHDERLDVTRRRFLRSAGVATVAGPSLAAAAVAASAKVSQKLAHYQQTPNGPARCQVCSQFLPQPSCKVVEDPITPSGWCLLYAAKAG